MGIKDWTVDVPSISGRLEENIDLCPSPEVAAVPLSYGFGEGLHGGGEGYSCGRHLMSVSADGNCAKCAFYEDRPVGHFRRGIGRRTSTSTSRRPVSGYRSWYSSRGWTPRPSAPAGHFSQGLHQCWKKVEHIPLADLDCDCDEIETCRGGCRYRAGKLGTPMGPMGKDLYRCASYGKIEYKQ